MTAQKVRKRPISLPPLPEPSLGEGFSRKQMLEFAEKTVSIDREAIFSRRGIIPLKKGSVSYRIMEFLQSGPKTTHAVTKQVTIDDPKKISAYLHNLYKRGHVRRESVYVPATSRHSWLWTAIEPDEQFESYCLEETSSATAETTSAVP